MAASNNNGGFSRMGTDPTVSGLRDGTDFPHSGIYHALNSATQGNYAIIDGNNFNITQTDVASNSRFVVAAGRVFRDGALVSAVSTATFNQGTPSTFDEPTSGNAYFLLVVNSSNALAILGDKATTDLVPNLTNRDEIPIAVIRLTSGENYDARHIQFLTTSKDENSLSIGHNASGYTESGNITGDANSIDIVSTPSNADINLVPNGTGKVGVGTASPATKLHVVGGATPIVRVDGGSNNGTTAIDNNIQGVEISKFGMNTTNKYNGGYKFTSTDEHFTTNNPKMLAAMVHRALQTYSGDTTGNSAIDFFIHDGTTTDGTGPASVKHTMTSSALGINTDAPDSELHVTGTSNPTITVQETGQTGHVKITALQDSQAQLIAENATASENCQFDIDSKAVNGQTQEIRFFRNSNSGADGYVSIKQTGSNNNAFLFYSDKDGTAHQFDFSSALRITAPSSDVTISNIVDDKDLIFKASTSSATNEIMRVDSTQQAVSIGTVTSNAKLTVNGDISRKGLIRNVTTVIGASGPPSPLPVYSVLDTDDLIIASAPSGGVPPNSLDVQLPDAGAEDIGRTYRIVAIDVAAGLTINRTGSDDVFVDEAFAGISLPLSLSVGKVYDITCVDANKWMVMTLN